jgi:5'-nucleotidase / UDP-sugar diphosphatase
MVKYCLNLFVLKTIAMKKNFIIFFLTALFLPLSAQDYKTITILHTNDLHSRLTGFAPESEYSPMITGNDKTQGGFARIASVIKREEASASGTVIVVDDGDFTMGTLFPGLEEKTGFQLRLMKEMGYDVVGLGNHEFDFGPGWLHTVIRTSAANGQIPALVLNNAIFDKNDKRDDGLEEDLADNILARKRIITRDGIKIGFFSILGNSAINNAPKAAPVKFGKQVSYAKKMVRELKAEKCNLIICLSHSGVSLDKEGKWGGEDVHLAEKVSGISAIISGHTHTKLEKPIMVNGIPIVQAGEFGEYVGALTLKLSGDKVEFNGYKLIPVNDMIAGDEKINSMIEAQKEKLNQEILKPLGLDYNMKIAETAFSIKGNDLGDYRNSNLGPLIADAIHFYINKHNHAGTDVSMVAAGMIFDQIVPGVQMVPDIFRVMPLGSGNDNVPGYALSRVFLTGKELKNVIEVLQMAGNSDAENYCYYSGIKVEYNPGKGLFKKVRKIEVVRQDGSTKNVSFSGKDKTLYSVAADSYMLGFIGIIKKKSFGLINVSPKDSVGVKITDMKKAVIDMNEKLDGIQEGKEWLALIEYFGSMKDTDGNGLPDIDKKYSGPGTSVVVVSY